MISLKARKRAYRIKKFASIASFVKKHLWLLWLPTSLLVGYSLNFHFNFNKIIKLQAETLAIKMKAENVYVRIRKTEKQYNQRVQRMAQETVKWRKCKLILAMEHKNGNK